MSCYVQLKITSAINICCSGSQAYQQVWLRGDPEGPAAHVHEGVKLVDKSGWVAIGDLLPGENQTPETMKLQQAIIRAVDNEAATKWTQTIGEENQNSANFSYTVGYSVIQVSLEIKIFRRTFFLFQSFGEVSKYKKDGD